MNSSHWKNSHLRLHSSWVEKSGIDILIMNMKEENEMRCDANFSWLKENILFIVWEEIWEDKKEWIVKK